MHTQTILAVLSAALLGVGLATDTSSAEDLKRLRGAIKIDGSSTVYPITEAVAEEFAEVFACARRLGLSLL